MTTSAHNVAIGVFSEAPGAFSFRTNEGVDLLPKQLVDVASVSINGTPWPTAYYKTGHNLTLSRPPNFDFPDDAVISWSGSYLDIDELYGDSRYTNLLARQHIDAPRFRALVAATTSSWAEIFESLYAIQSGFDIDQATGVQLDAIGLWVGLSRQVRAKIEGVYFTWDDAENPTQTGWDYGIWEGRYGEDSGIETLPDDVYRRLLKAKSVANRWDGTISGIHEIWSAFTGSTIRISDNQDMTMDVTVVGVLSGLEKILLQQGYITVRPAGVMINSYSFTDS